MTLPEAIPVRYSEEEAGYVTFRPVVRQTFRRDELLDMILSVTGKDPGRIRQILRSGTVVFHFYRYWWEGFEAGEDELNALLAGFPDSDPTRAFSPAACTLALLESGESPARTPLELHRGELSHKRLLRRRSFWDELLAAGAAGPLAYQGYSHAHHADMYRVPLTDDWRARLDAAAESLAPRFWRTPLRALSHTAGIVFICPRTSATVAK